MIESKGGESIKGMTIKDPELIEFSCRVSEALGIIGPANVQCFREPDGELLVTDVNPRFGGGFPLPTAAGSRYPELALALANGERPEPRLGDFREGVVMTRFFSQVILEDADGTLEPAQAEAVPGRGVRRLVPLLAGRRCSPPAGRSARPARPSPAAAHGPARDAARARRGSAAPLRPSR